MAMNALDSAISGLRVAQQQLDIISNNVANASSPGYTEKILPQTADAINGVTVGVSAGAVTRNVDLDLESEFWTQTSQVSYLNTQATYLNKIQTFNGTPGSDDALSAKISDLQNTFSTLSNEPDSSADQTSVVTAATAVANKLNDFSTMLVQMRNNTQTDMQTAIADVNTQLKTIANLNSQISFNQSAGQSTAALADSRDSAIKALSNDMSISYFVRSDGVMVVQTTNGVALADTNAQTVSFSPGNLDAASGSGNAIYVGTANQANPINISSAGNATGASLGGTLGALIDLRDTIIPTQQASLDQTAAQLANRFNAQGLKLFTDGNGNIPSSAPANMSTTPPTPVAYVGFAGKIQVNQAVLDNNALVQQGTVPTDDPVQSDSNEVINRITNNAFGTTAYQQASGTVNLKTAGATDLQHLLGLYSSNQVTGSVDLVGSSSLSAITAADPASFGSSGSNDKFTVTFGESRTSPALGPTTITVSLGTAATDFPINGTTISSAADQLAAEINKQIALPATAMPAGLAASATTNSYGQLVLKSTGNITIDASSAGGMGTTGLADLGLTAGTTVTTDPYITVQVGSGSPVQVAIAPGDTSADLVANLDKTGSSDSSGVDGLAVSLDPVTGHLTLRPGDSTTNPTFGGSLSISGGPFTTDGTGSIAGGMAAGTDIVKALFGSDVPVQDVPNTAFQSTNLGATANLSTGVTSNGSIVDYAQQVINGQAQQYNTLTAQQTSETSYAATLQTNLQNSSGVNIDEELSNMVVVQNAYAASARLITTIQAEFNALMQAFQ